MATWLTPDDEDLDELWPDAHLLRPTVLATYLNAAKEACIAYAPAAPLAPPEFAPATLTYPDGTKLELSRDGDIVTASATAGTAPNGPHQPIPAGYAPAGNVFSYSASDSLNWAVIINETTIGGPILGIACGTLGPAPWKPFSVQWLADPAVPVPTIPDGWRLAQALQAQNAFNANNAAPGNGDFDGSGYGITTHPLDWQVKQLLRPKRALGAIA